MHAYIITRQVTLPDGSSIILYVVLCGVKGDWPYLSISEALGPRMHVSVLHAFFLFLELSGKCHSLWTGFTSLRKCHYCKSSESLTHSCAKLAVYMHAHDLAVQLFAQDWYNVKTSAQWRSERPSNENPVRDPPPLMHTLPGGGPCESPPDQMHTWHHGVGREFVASCIVSFQAFRCHACWVHACG